MKEYDKRHQPETRERWASIEFLKAANILWGEKAYLEAEDCLREGLDFHPNDPRLHDALGGRMDKMGRHEEALRLHRRAVELEPHNTLNRTHYAVMLAKMGYAEEAEKQMFAVIKANSEREEYLDYSFNQLGRIYLNMRPRRCRDAANAFALSLKAHPGYNLSKRPLENLKVKRGVEQTLEGMEMLAKRIAEFDPESAALPRSDAPVPRPMAEQQGPRPSEWR